MMNRVFGFLAFFGGYGYLYYDRTANSSILGLRRVLCGFSMATSTASSGSTTILNVREIIPCIDSIW